MRRALLISLCCALSVSLASAQSRRAAREYFLAQQAFAKHSWSKAEAHIRKAIREDGAYTDAYGTLSQWLLARHDYKGCIALLQQGEKLCPKGDVIFKRPLTAALLGSGDYTAALPRMGADTFYRKLRSQALFQQQAALEKDTAAVMPVGPPWRVNSADPELFPFLSADGQTLYFTRRVAGIDEDFYTAKPDTCDGGWLTARAMGAPFNSLQQEAAQSISSDGHYLFFMRCDNRSELGWEGGGCDLYMAYTADSVWSVPQSFGATINSPGYEGMPCLSPDNRILYFVSDRPGGYGGLDIWCAKFERGLWQLPYNLGPAINTPGNETAPFICSDNATLYFASDGHAGMGGTDLFVSRKADTSWGAALNLGMPVNTPFDEASPSVSADGSTLFFASDKDSVAGNFDLYQTQLPAARKPAETILFSGEVHDSTTGQRLNYANIFISDSATGAALYQVVSNRGDGSYAIALPTGHTYSLYLDRIGYQNASDTLRCIANDSVKKHLRNFAMLPFGYEKPVKDSAVLTLRFSKNSSELSDSSQAALRAAMQAWQGKAGIAIMVNGYTDNTGTPIINEQLSFTRARSVGAVLKGMGFDDSVIKVQGWGEANPLTGNDTDANRDMNRRVEIVVRM